VGYTIVQTAQSADFGDTLAFDDGTTPGNTVLVACFGYLTGSGTLNYGSVFAADVAATLLKSIQSVAADSPVIGIAFFYSTDIAGGTTECSFEPGGSTSAASIFAWEIEGDLPAILVIDQQNAAAANSGEAVSSGPTGDITAAPEIIFGAGVAYGVGIGEPTGGWTYLSDEAGYCWAGYQTAAEEGSSYTWGQTASSTATWAALAFTLGAGDSSLTASAALTVTPSFTAAAADGKLRSAALTVTPVFSATAHESGSTSHTATAALTVVPSFTATRSGGVPSRGAWAPLDAASQFLLDLP
jgi:hypothetical protein